ncbi:hypothetical protein C8R45DRAFT_947799 [Mycena sanguinolenta]|nr:hypothetical protein C8R45DRAFT_947799 [Mycena sanguinolenta]
MFRPGFGLKAGASARLGGLGLFKIPGQAIPARPGSASAWLWPRPGLLELAEKKTRARDTLKAAAFRLGLGLEECQAGLKAGSGPHVGSARARLAEPKSRGFAASGPGRNITSHL